MASKSEKKEGWACTRCTFLNTKTFKHCELCFGVNEEAMGMGPAENEDNGEKWTCACTHLNRMTDELCRACGAPMPTSDSIVCPTCTFKNRAGSRNCQMCNHNFVPKKPVSSKTEIPSREPRSGPEDIPRKKRKMKRGYRRKSRKSKNGHGSSPQSNGKLFTEVSEIFERDESDVHRIKEEEKRCEELLEMYRHVYFAFQDDGHNASKEKMTLILDRLMTFIPKKDDSSENDESDEDDDKDRMDIDRRSNPGPPKEIEIFDECQVCFSEFDKETQCVTMKGKCNHAMICQRCFVRHIQVKINDEDVCPWLPCPAPECTAPIHPSLLFDHITNPRYLYQFAKSFIRNHLARNPNWVPCENSKKMVKPPSKKWEKDDKKRKSKTRVPKCEWGFIVLTSDYKKMKKKGKKPDKEKCDGCGLKQRPNRDPMAMDEGLSGMMKSGVMRKCPKCNLPTIKDKGICNVIQCGKCSIWWNWKTRDTGTNSRDLKMKARMNGTLWGPGELAYQQNLQRNDLPAFIKLLESNGMKYDPHYRRGGW